MKKMGALCLKPAEATWFCLSGITGSFSPGMMLINALKHEQKGALHVFREEKCEVSAGTGKISYQWLNQLGKLSLQDSIKKMAESLE